MFDQIKPTRAERAQPLPGDDIVPDANVVMDRAFTVPGTPARVWPWIQQLGKQRAGWYLPPVLDRLLPRTRRAIRHVDDRWQHLAIGDVVPDYGPNNTFTVADIAPDQHVVYTSGHKHLVMSWAITLTPAGTDHATATRVRLRLRLGPVRRTFLARTFGDAFDALTVSWMASGLRDRLSYPPGTPRRVAVGHRVDCFEPTGCTGCRALMPR